MDTGHRWGRTHGHVAQVGEKRLIAVARIYDRYKDEDVCDEERATNIPSAVGRQVEKGCLL